MLLLGTKKMKGRLSVTPSIEWLLVVSNQPKKRELRGCSFFLMVDDTGQTPHILYSPDDCNSTSRYSTTNTPFLNGDKLTFPLHLLLLIPIRRSDICLFRTSLRDPRRKKNINHLRRSAFPSRLLYAHEI